jgi:hypothetical protein
MANLPAAAYLSAADRTVAQMKQGLEDVVAFIRQEIGGDAEDALVISGGSVTPEFGVSTIDTEAAASTDDLANILQSNLPDGSTILIRAASAARVVTVKHNAGGAGSVLLLGAVDCVLNATNKYLWLKRNATTWEEVGRFGFEDGIHYATTVGGTGDVTTLTVAGKTPSSWYTGMMIAWVVAATNTVTTPTINPNSIGAKTVVDRSGSALAASDLRIGSLQLGVYDGTNVRALFLPNAPSLSIAQQWSLPQRPQAKETANKTGSVSADFALYQDFDWTLTGNLTLANPTLTAAMVGQRGSIRIAHAGFLLSAIGSNWKRIGATGAPTLSTTSGVICRIDYHIVSTSRIEYRYSEAEA